MRLQICAIAWAVLATALCLESTRAQSPTGWSPVVIPRGDYRTQIQALPIDQRPGRLLHVYGNTVRMVDQTRSGGIRRPMRQILVGTPVLRSEFASRR